MKCWLLPLETLELRLDLKVYFGVWDGKQVEEIRILPACDQTWFIPPESETITQTLPLLSLEFVVMANLLDTSDYGPNTVLSKSIKLKNIY